MAAPVVPALASCRAVTPKLLDALMSIEGYCAYWRGKHHAADADMPSEESLASTIRAHISERRRAEFTRALAQAEGIEVVEHAAPE